MNKPTFFFSLILVVAISVVACVSPAKCATNPFLSRQSGSTVNDNAPSKPEAVKRTSPFGRGAAVTGGKPGLYNSVMLKVTLLQKDIRVKLTGFARDIKKEPFGASFWFFLAFSFAYGIVHAVGPGHGKSVVCAYFLSRGGTMFAAAFMSWMITLVHVGSATVAVCLAYLFFSKGMAGFEQFNHHLQTGSYALVMVIGLWLVVSALRSFRSKADDCGCCDSSEGDSLKEIATVAFVTGVVPCPGAAIILVYTLSTGLLWAGLIAMIFLATGMAVTTCLFAFTAAKTRCVMDNASSRFAVFYSVLSLIGASIIFAFGLLMLMAHLSG